MNEFFRKFAHKTANLVGSPWTFIGAVAIIIAWAITGPLFHFSDTWQLVINTGTTIITFLMVFLIQNTQNRDAKALHLKLDELLRAITDARTGLVDLEDMSDEELQKLEAEFARLRQQNTPLLTHDIKEVETVLEQRKDRKSGPPNSMA
jgi:low affinity Fe/Cu permease